ncbi:MAG: L-threonylcarbamoyladenylate synthase [Cyanobacteria bacterium P01_H01_bin.121]
MAKRFSLHPDTPQQRVIDQIRAELRSGGVILYPTDTVYAIGCDLNVKAAVQRVRQIKQFSNDKPLTFICSSMSQASNYAYIHDSAYRLIRHLIPGPYTFLLPATKLVPKTVMNPQRKTAGIRVPDSPVCKALIEALDNPIISTSAHMPEPDPDLDLLDEDEPETAAVLNAAESPPAEPIDAASFFDRLEKQVDAIVSIEGRSPRVLGQDPEYHVSTIIDLTDDEPILLRKGLGWEAAADLI